MKNKIISVLAAVIMMGAAVPAFAAGCDDLPSYEILRKRLIEARHTANGGMNLEMWATIVDRGGTVCAVAYSGSTYDAQWPGSRVISAQKANTANAFSVKDLALSTANLYSAVQPGGSLFGLQDSNPVDTAVAYKGFASDYGTKKDSMVGKRIGGVNVFGGGLALYNIHGQILGGLGVSGDSSCADHNIAWKMRNAMGLDYVPLGVSVNKDDGIIYDVTGGKSASGFGHPTCGGTEDKVAAEGLPKSK